jgi:hypothetical protein
MNWYNEKIEQPLREIVKDLRNNGINTVCSCGHDMYIECEIYDAQVDMNTIYNVLMSNNIPAFEIHVIARFEGGHYQKHIRIEVGDDILCQKEMAIVE